MGDADVEMRDRSEESRSVSESQSVIVGSPSEAASSSTSAAPLPISVDAKVAGDDDSPSLAKSVRNSAEMEPSDGKHSEKVEEQNNDDNEDDNDDDDSISEEVDADNIRVLVRVRPLIDTERTSRVCVSVDSESSAIRIECKPQRKVFVYDKVAGLESTQEEIFQMVGRPISNACLRGYNGTIFAYGQTASGKTFTMEGDCGSPEKRGLMPRVFDYLFSQMNRQVSRRGEDAVQYLVKVCCVEVYNEIVQDLLEPENSHLQIREDMRRGVFVNNLSEHPVSNAEECLRSVRTAMMHRRVSSTSMNRESSRSHLIFTVIIECCDKSTGDGITRKRSSRFNLVDLAGSERQTKTKSSGMRLREAGAINKSLLTLGHVMKALASKGAADSQNNNQRDGSSSSTGASHSGGGHHIHYRDSKLTFLLKDSLGGNSLTFMIANLSPASDNLLESLSTLQFAARAKYIRNQAKLNEDQSGTVRALKSENARLVDQLARMKNQLQILQSPMPPPGSKYRSHLSTHSSSSSDHGLRAMSDSTNVASLSLDGRKLQDCLEILERQNYGLRQERECLTEIAEQLRDACKQHRDSAMGYKLALKLRESALKRGKMLPTDMIEDGQQMAMSEACRVKALFCEERIKCIELQKESKSMMDFIHRFVEDSDANTMRYDQLQKWKHAYETLVDSNHELREQLSSEDVKSAHSSDIDDDSDDGDGGGLAAVVGGTDQSDSCDASQGSHFKSDRRRRSSPVVTTVVIEESEQYLQLKEECESLKQSMESIQNDFKVQLDNVKDERDSAINERNNLRMTVDELRSKITLNELRFEGEKSELEKYYDQQLSEARGGIEIERSSLAEQNNELRRSLAHLTGNNEALKSENEQLKSVSSLNETRINELNEQVSQMNQLTENNHQLSLDLEHLQTKHESLSEERMKLSEELTILNERMKLSSTELRKVRDLLAKKESSMSRLQAEHEVVRDELSKKRIQMDEIMEEKEILTDVYNTLKDEKDELAASKLKIELNLSELNNTLDKQRSKCKEIEQRMNEMRKEMNESVSNSDSRLKSMHNQNESLRTELLELREMKDILDERNENLLTKLNLQITQNNETNEKNLILNTRINDLEIMYDRSLNKNKELNNELESIMQTMDDWKEKAKNYNNELIAIRIDNESLLKEKQELLNRADEFEKEAQSTVDEMGLKLTNYINELKQMEKIRDESNILHINELKHLNQKLNESKNLLNKQELLIEEMKKESLKCKNDLMNEIQQLKQSLDEKQALVEFTQKQVEEFGRSVCESPLRRGQRRRVSSSNDDNNNDDNNDLEDGSPSNTNDSLSGSTDASAVQDVFKRAQVKMARIEAELREKLITSEEERTNLKSAMKRMSTHFQGNAAKQTRYIQSLEDLLKVKDRQCDELKRNVEESENKRSILVDEVRDLRKCVDELKNIKLKLTTRVHSLERMVENFKTEHELLDQRCASDKSLITSLTEDLKKIKRQLNESIKERMDSVQTARRMRLAEEKAYKEMYDWKRRFNEIDEVYNRDKAEFDRLKLRNNQLESENSKLAGHNNEKQRIKHLMNLKKEVDSLKRERKILKRQLSGYEKRFGLSSGGGGGQMSDSGVMSSSSAASSECGLSMDEDDPSVGSLRSEVESLKSTISASAKERLKGAETGIDPVSLDDLSAFESLLGALKVSVETQSEDVQRLVRVNETLKRDMQIQDEQIRLMRDEKNLAKSFDKLGSHHRTPLSSTKNQRRGQPGRRQSSEVNADPDSEMKDASHR